ncbi:MULTISPECIES: nicotinate phosphoribosyltransferase [unclassified Curtobacterium]|uniref:nicotinate phosphoribosyltransferase n=2 Tax=unclassified Curtobacterium TaxID=257496 RepID=UPI0008F2C6E7|nr:MULTISPECIES: nicotinate phosphoribosyltransferase [unclassified Curtobacterium]SFF37486.1 nicotinate phosphoribosyltransferase [Curtobacterium sp. YR515]
MTSALLTDQYELTMVDAALKDGTADRRCVFEVFARRLPDGRRYGVAAGLGRFLTALTDFRFGDDEIAFLRDRGVIDAGTASYLADYRFTGDIRAYREGEVFFPNSPVLQIEGTFAEAVVLETLALSIFNADSAIASAAARMVSAADGRPLAEMGSRRTGEWNAVAAARAAYIAGFGATSNLEAGRTWGIPTMGTAAHAFTLLHDSEEDAFRSQIDALGTGTTLLVDTYDIEAAVDTAVRLTDGKLGAVRIDSGDLPSVVASVRAQLDRLGATDTKITVTNDLDEYTIAALRAAPVDSYGVGTSVVSGSGHPAAGMVFKLVAHRDASHRDASHRDAADGGAADDGWVPVAKKSAEKATVGGRKQAGRRLRNGIATAEVVLTTGQVGPDERPLLVPVVTNGEVDPAFLGVQGVEAARAHHKMAKAELPADASRIGRGDPAIPTLVI